MSLSFSSRNPSTLSVEELESVEDSTGREAMEEIWGKRLEPEGEADLRGPVL